MRGADQAARTTGGLPTLETNSHRCVADRASGDASASPRTGAAPFAGTGFYHDASVLDAAFAAARMGIWECSLPDEALMWTDGVYDLFDLPRGAMPDRSLVLRCYEPETRAELVALRAEAIATVSGFELDARIVTARGVRRWIRITATVQARDGVPFRIFGIKRDITEERTLMERTRHLAEHDVLTGLKNRLSFNTRLDALADRTAEAGSPKILMLLDLDGFKAVNDGLGHQVGDDVLKMAGERIRASCGDDPFVARTGGDEFAVLLDGELEIARSVASRIVAEMAKPMVVAGTTIRVGVSIGIAKLEGEAGPSSLYRAADAALYDAKAAGRGTHRTFATDRPGPG